MKRPPTHVLKWPFGAFEILCSFQEKETELMLSDLICRTNNLSDPLLYMLFSIIKWGDVSFNGDNKAVEIFSTA
ncbi:hypothetical protein EYW51_09120 [Bacillus altitudinis]|nr:hypothetical protein [Bacillus altitudinis]